MALPRLTLGQSQWGTKQTRMISQWVDTGDGQILTYAFEECCKPWRSMCLICGGIIFRFRWRFSYMRYPQIVHFYRIFLYKPSISGYPHLWNPPRWIFSIHHCSVTKDLPLFPAPGRDLWQLEQVCSGPVLPPAIGKFMNPEPFSPFRLLPLWKGRAISLKPTCTNCAFRTRQYDTIRSMIPYLGPRILHVQHPNPSATNPCDVFALTKFVAELCWEPPPRRSDCPLQLMRIPFEL